MPKRAATLELTLPPRPAQVPAHRWLYDALRGAILAGQLRPGTRLPSTRDLAQRYGLARGTVVRAAEQLAAEGYLDTSVGAGTFVARSLPDDLQEAPAAALPTVNPGGVAKHPLARYGRLATAFALPDPRPIRAFRSDLPAVDLFPTALWAQLAGRRLRNASARDLLFCHPLGHGPLRAAVADYLRISRGVRCTSEQVAIVSGVQEALDLAARLLVEPGDAVAVEDPGYPGAAQLLAAAGATVVGVPVDAEGLVVDSPELACAQLVPARLVYVTPAHQYPLGVTMSLPRRLELLDWARRTGGWIFEDDYDSEFRYVGRPMPALQGLDDSDSVLFAGSFNKVLFPTLRLGYLVLPPDLVDRATAARSISARHPPLFEQRVLVDFIADGHFGRHLRRMREIYAERLTTLLSSAREELAGRLELSTVEAGLQTSGLLHGFDDEEVARAAAAHGVEVTPLSRFYRVCPPVQGLQLGFAAVDPSPIRRGVGELAGALDRLVRA
jgi:GntR family transcriptional regulator/MocR family aminotransferase